MLITAKFSTTCPVCGNRIAPGARVEWSRGTQARHPTCKPAGRPQAQPQAQPRVQPPPGSWAATAFVMAEGDDSGFDWDRWKDEMKERDWEEETPYET